MCQRGFCARAAGRGWTAMKMSTAPSPPGPASWVCSRESAPRSSSTSTCGEWRSLARRGLAGSPDSETRIAEFADLVATAIAASTTRAELIASRARIVAAADDARRRLERDLHDGAQQRLVALGLGLRAAEACVPDELQPLKEQIAALVTTTAAVSAEVQEISRGIHPAILSRGGLGPALKTLARRSAVPVDLDLHVDRRFADRSRRASTTSSPRP